MTTSTLSLLNWTIGDIATDSTALLTSIAIFITNENLSKLKIKYTKLRDWSNVITLQYAELVKQSMLNRMTYEEEASELEEICDQ